MITWFFIATWVLLAAAALYVAFDKLCRKGTSFKFNNYPDVVDVPYITMDIQGNLLNLVVDSGCGVSLFGSDVFKDREFMYRKTNSSVHLAAITSDNVKSDLMRIDFNIGKKEVYEDFALCDVNDFGNFERMCGIKVHGILGSSFFDRYKCKIDYSKHRLIIP